MSATADALADDGAVHDHDPDGSRAELLQLVKTAEALDG